MPELEKLVSYCVVCDAEPGKCNHGGHRYLDPIVYEKVEGGWAAPNAAEKDRFHNPPAVVKGAKPNAAVKIKPIQQIIVELEEWMPVDSQLETAIRTAYESDPRAVTLVAQSVISQADSLHSPAGLLITKLRSLA